MTGNQEYSGSIENQYLSLLDDILTNGYQSGDRTGTGTRKVFGRTLRADLTQGYPLLTTKSVHFPSVAHELIWFISGSTNIKYLHDRGITIWDEWADANGEVGRMYGVQWRHWVGPDGKETDQLQKAIDKIHSSPNDRRIIVSAWNPAEVDKMALPPCHALYQFDVQGERLSCAMFQRSIDTFLGLPFNIASYAALTKMIASLTDLTPHELILFLGNTHLYLNHLAQAKIQLERDSRPLPKLEIIHHRTKIDDFVFEDFRLLDYNPHPKIRAPISK
ncbi:MAG: thymidylate synthase [Patescibacteria group bacterium]|nr:thymidylate synthase [Patescibacteria group bacterium]MCL5432190.1 thymidylate synthase [Patescibacteria group bacterium]